MWCYLTKTLLCIICLQPRSLGARSHRVCMCDASIQKWMQGQTRAHVVELNAESIHVADWLERGGWEGWEREMTDGSFSLKQASTTWSTCLLDARDRERVAWQIWKAVFTQERPSALIKDRIQTESQWRHPAAADGTVTASFRLLCTTFYHPIVSRPILSYVDKWKAWFDLKMS